MQNNNRSLAFLFSLVFANLSLVACGLYPTQPIASTVFTVGDWNQVKWIDDSRKPHLSELKPCSLQVYSDDGGFVGTLADNVSPKNRSQTVFFPTTWNWTDYSS